MDNVSYNINNILEPFNKVNVVPTIGMKINICAFQIIKTTNKPFIQYLLLKQPEIMELEFPSYNIMDNEYKDLHINSVEFLKKNLKERMDDNFDTTQDIECMGCIHRNNVYHIFYDLSNVIFDYKPLLWSYNQLWFALIDEIMNVKHVCGITIMDSVTCFFEQNTELIHLKNNNNNEIIKSPMIGYIGRIDKYLHFTYTFGVSKSLCDSLFGEKYYYTSFENSFKNNWIINNYFEQDLNKNIDNTKSSFFEFEEKLFTHGIVRSAMFMDNTKYLTNIKVCTDDFHIDNNNKVTFLNKEKFLLENNWYLMYDSLILTNMNLDHTKKFKGPPAYVLSELDQQFPLSYHYFKPSDNANSII